MKATLKQVGGPSETSAGNFYSYQLRFPEVAFTIVRFLPHYHEAREVLNRVELPNGDKLFHAREHHAGHGTLIFLREIDNVWAIYRLIGLPRNASVDVVWTIAETGVSYPGAEQAIALKTAIASIEGCQVTLSFAETLFQRAQEHQAEAARAETLRKQREAESVEAAKRAEARAERDRRKQQLRLPANTRTFTTAGGKPWNGFVVADEQEAQMLEDRDRAVFLNVARQVERVLVVHKNRSNGRVTFDELKLASTFGASQSKAASNGQRSNAATSKLSKFGTFRRPEGKRKEDESDTVAYYVTAKQLEQLKANRPEELVTVALPVDDRFHVYTIHPDRVDDRGFMERVEAEVKKRRHVQAPQFGGRLYASV
ncbi:hypothetical protein H6778_01495 [Candidatus Nomurabacteria bacterium]|nr:hypothetical protein [Candidatus Nomurabacteria bacterium]